MCGRARTTTPRLLAAAAGLLRRTIRISAAEWGRSSFERRHAVNADYTIELPWGSGRHWLNNTSMLAQIFGGWSWSGSLVAQSGGPFTPRVTGNFIDVGSGVNGTLRADYDGSDISVSDPTTLRYLQHRRVLDSRVGLFRYGGPEPHHRARIAQPEHEPLKERHFRPDARGVHPGPGDQRAQYRAVLIHRHGRQLADLRSGDGSSPDAFRPTDSAFQILRSMPAPSIAVSARFRRFCEGGWHLSGKGASHLWSWGAWWRFLRLSRGRRVRSGRASSSVRRSRRASSSSTSTSSFATAAATSSGI